MLILALRSEGTIERGRLVVLAVSTAVEWSESSLTSMVRGPKKTTGPESSTESVVRGWRKTVRVIVYRLGGAEVVVERRLSESMVCDDD